RALAELDRMPAFDAAAVGYVAHALNNYLTVTEATLDLLDNALRPQPNQEIGRWLRGLRHVSSLMQHTISQLVRVSAPGDFRLKPEYVDVAVLLERACAYYRGEAQRKHLDIVFDRVGDVPAVWADRVAVAVVAGNLISNAVKFSKPPGTIHVRTMNTPEGVITTVRDCGPGITTDERERLFQRGVSLGGTRTGGETSSGYGLAIAREFVERMGGRIWCDSEPGQGARFSFLVPHRDSPTTSIH
ncbi:MAG TPA: HAMP domain-containing sensor histidine kinase, partial [Vicinamibacterales bacterium]|nr:HAMP domain-containing sensor histidine kinase [Vicinamibacterales bacterium]